MNRYKQLDEGNVKVSEKNFTGQILDLARLCGWTAAHFRAAMTQHGWRTPVQADGAGFPDLVLVRPPKCLFIELKSDKGELSPKQEQWLKQLSACPGISVCVWRPGQFHDIVKCLR